MPVTIEQVLVAMNKPTDEWITRRNKMRDHTQWELVHRWGDTDLISDDTQEVVAHFSTQHRADEEAFDRGQRAVAQNILDLFSTEFEDDDSLGVSITR